jgi:hypothetical protein
MTARSIVDFTAKKAPAAVSGGVLTFGIAPRTAL